VRPPVVVDPGLFKTGATVGGLYRVHEKIGEGAFGEVWSGATIATGERVALKRLHASVAANIESFRRFRREAALLAKVKSDFVAKLVNFLPDPNHGLVLVLEFIDGAPLSDLFRVQTISVEMAIDIGIDVLCAIRDLHAAGIVHRDIKPANVIMRPLPNGDSQAILCDFSTSRLVGGPPKSRRSSAMGGTPSTQSLTPTGATVGTIHYMSPEQVLSSREVTERTDIYAVGAVLFRGVAGVHVFEEDEAGLVSMARTKLMQEAPPLRTGRSDAVARAFEEVVWRSLRRNPTDRYASASEMLEAFLELHKLAAAQLEGERPSDAPSPQPPLVDPSGGPSSRRKEQPTGAPSSEKPARLSSTTEAPPSSRAPARHEEASQALREAALAPRSGKAGAAMQAAGGPRISVTMFAVSLIVVFALGLLTARLLSTGAPSHGEAAPPSAPTADPPK
jgi:eukaryotic-like serine/threonine-protein kinase